MVSSATNGMCPSGIASVPCADMSVICWATPFMLMASSSAWLASLAAWPASLSSMASPKCSCVSGGRRGERRMHDLAALRHQRALHHLVVEVDLQRLGLFVDHRRQEVEQVAG